MSTFVISSDFDKKHFILDLPLCRLLLDENAEYPWFILVPKINDVCEITDLSTDERAKMWLEIEQITRISQKIFNPDKINIGILGNKTKQLHIHVISRFKTDSSWPNAVWGSNCTNLYTEKRLNEIKTMVEFIINNQSS